MEKANKAHETNEELIFFKAFLFKIIDIEETKAENVAYQNHI